MPPNELATGIERLDPMIPVLGAALEPLRACRSAAKIREIDSSLVDWRSPAEEEREASASRETASVASVEAAAASAEVDDSSPEVEAALRKALDAHGADDLACAATDRVVVRLSYDEASGVTLSLNGPAAGSAEEGCVRAALCGAEWPPVEGAGEILHLVRSK